MCVCVWTLARELRNHCNGARVETNFIPNSPSYSSIHRKISRGVRVDRVLSLEEELFGIISSWLRFRCRKVGYESSGRECITLI